MPINIFKTINTVHAKSALAITDKNLFGQDLNQSQAFDAHSEKSFFDLNKLLDISTCVM